MKKILFFLLAGMFLVMIQLEAIGADTDGDGVPDEFDNCVYISNSDQIDSSVQYAPTEPYPAVGDQCVPVRYAQLSWQGAYGATCYDLYLWKQGDPRPNVPTAVDLTVTAYPLPDAAPLDFATTYVWEVVAKGSDIGQVSAQWTFITTDSIDGTCNKLTDWEILTLVSGYSNDYDANAAIGLLSPFDGGFLVDPHTDGMLYVGFTDGAVDFDPGTDSPSKVLSGAMGMISPNSSSAKDKIDFILDNAGKIKAQVPNYSSAKSAKHPDYPDAENIWVLHGPTGAGYTYNGRMYRYFIQANFTDVSEDWIITLYYSDDDGLSWQTINGDDAFPAAPIDYADPDVLPDFPHIWSAEQNKFRWVDGGKLFPDNGYYYVYGTGINLQAGVYVARFPKTDVIADEANYTYWNGSSWVAGANNAASILNTPEAAFQLAGVSVSYNVYDGTYYLMVNNQKMDGTLMTGQYDFPDMLYYTAVSPQGPFTYQGTRSPDFFDTYHAGPTAPEVIRYEPDGSVYFLTAMYNTPEAEAALQAAGGYVCLPYGYGVYLCRATLRNFVPAKD